MNWPNTHLGIRWVPWKGATCGAGEVGVGSRQFSCGARWSIMGFWWILGFPIPRQALIIPYIPNISHFCSLRTFWQFLHIYCINSIHLLCCTMTSQMENPYYPPPWSTLESPRPAFGAAFGAPAFGALGAGAPAFGAPAPRRAWGGVPWNLVKGKMWGSDIRSDRCDSFYTL